MTIKTAQRKAEALAPGRSIIVTAQEQKTVHSGGAGVTYGKRCSITVFDKNGDNCTAFDCLTFAGALDKVRSAIATLP